MSLATFWEEKDKERCHGIVWKVLSGGQFARVRWDIDGRSQCVGVANLQLEAEEGGLEPSAEGRRVFQLFSYSSCNEGFNKKKAQAPVVLMMMPVKVRVRTRVISRANLPMEAGRGSFTSTALKCHETWESPAEVDLNNGKVTAHGLEWKFVDDVSVDAYKDNRHKPKLRVAGPASMSVLDF